MNTERRQLQTFLESHGVDPGRSGVMAAQLQKRADQLERERGIGRLDAMEYLLKVFAHGRRGEVYRGGGQSSGEVGERHPGNPHKHAD
jgi:hypothetical protein